MRGDGPRRSWWVVAVLVVALLATLAGYLVGSRVRSPQEVAASARPPAVSEIFAVVRKGSVHTSAQFTGVVTWRQEFAAEVVPGASRMRPVVTRLPLSPNVTFGAGAVLLEVADRPVIALEGAVPMLRDLSVGDRGADVTRLQTALKDAGHYGGMVDGRFGDLTGAALRSLYQAAGYDVPVRPARPGGADGPIALASELSFVPSLPATLLDYPAGLGEEVEAIAARVGFGGLRITLDVTADWLPALRRARTTISLDVHGPRRLRGRVVRLARPRLVDGERMVRVVLRASGVALAPRSVGSDAVVRLREQTGPAGLKVPLSALFASASDGDFVRKELAEGSEAVPVFIHATGNGAAIVEPRGRRVLAVGDRVVVGTSAP